jgi:hypothetical protein
VPEPGSPSPATYTLPSNADEPTISLNDLAGAKYDDAMVNTLNYSPKPGSYKFHSVVTQTRPKDLTAVKYHNARIKYPPKPSYYNKYKIPLAAARKNLKYLSAAKYHDSTVHIPNYPPRPYYYSNHNIPAAAAQPGQDPSVYYYNKAPIVYNYPPVYQGAYPQPSYPSYYRYNRYGRR